MFLFSILKSQKQAYVCLEIIKLSFALTQFELIKVEKQRIWFKSNERKSIEIEKEREKFPESWDYELWSCIVVEYLADKYIGKIIGTASNFCKIMEKKKVQFLLYNWVSGGKMELGVRWNSQITLWV